MDEYSEFHPVLDGYGYTNGETLRQRIDRKTKEYGEAWTEVMRLLVSAEQLPAAEPEDKSAR